ncbi:MAG: PAS domain-containing protein [Acidobacteria bacterium]|nr:PAS domain-containing protein [Acidobacteriota bacterium]
MKGSNKAFSLFGPGSGLRPAFDPESAPAAWILIGAVGLLSYLVARLSGALVLRPEMIWPFWPGCAFLVAVIVSTRPRLWPWLLLAGFTGFTFSDVHSGLAPGTISLLLLSDVGEILVVAIGIQYAFSGRLRLNTTRSLLKYLLIAGVLGPMVAAAVCTFALSGGHWFSWRISFLTEALALLTLTPAILGWVDIACGWKRRPRAYYIEIAAMIAALVAAGFLTFVTSAGSHHPELFYSLVPFLLWAALRLGMTGISTVMVIVAFLSTWGAVHGQGPFAGSETPNNVLSLQIFLLCAAIPFMFLAALAEEHKAAHESLRESESRFRLVSNTAPVMICMGGPDRQCIYFNQPWLDFTGRTLEAEIAEGWISGVHPEDVERCLTTYTRAFDRLEEFRMEYRMRRNDGEYRWVLNHGVPRFTPEGVFAGYIGSAIDVTDAKAAQTKLEQTTERLRLAMEAGGIGGWEVDLKANGKVRFGTKAPTLLGLAPEADSGSPEKFWAQVHPQDRPRLARALEGAKHNHAEFDHEFRVFGQDGSLHWFRTKGKYVYSPAGEPERILGISVETTQRKRAEQALRESEERLRLAVEAGRMAAYSWDARTDKVEHSGHSAQILGIDDRTSITGAEVFARIHPGDREAVMNAIAGLGVERPILQLSHRMIRPDGSVIWAEGNGRAYFDEDGKVTRIVGMVADISERKRAEEVLGSLNRRLIEAQEADRARIARDLHDDIGQQLALLSLGLAQLNRFELSGNGDAKSMIDRMEKQLLNISSTVNSLSHRLHSSSLKHLGLKAAARSCCKELASQQGVEINFRDNTDSRPLPPELALCFFRVLQEALQNGIKHSGVRHFEVELQEDSDFLQLTVSDLGSGFDLETAMNGPGLGLVSMRERLKLVNGELQIRSRSQGGTTVIARAPVAPLAARALVAV